MRYIIRLRLVNELGEGFTDIPIDQLTADALIDAGCDSWKTPGPYEREPSVTYVETYNLAYVQELGRQRDQYRKQTIAQELLLGMADSIVDDVLAEGEGR
jgi:hypothetical protein